jgi:PKD repeat protein
VFVESSDPIPQFLITPSNDWKYPSEFILDASLSSDVDVTNGFDNLSYEWSFSEDAKTNIVNTQNNNQLIKVQFDTVGTHTIKLVAKDDYGKQAEISKDITITSTLRPEIFAVPLATPWGNPVNFVVKSNLPLINYQWDFGDGTTSTIQSDKVTHTYKASGVYKVVLKVSGSDGMTNEVTKNVFIGDKDYPVGAFTVLDKSSNILTQNEFCLDASGSTIPAYQIQRYQDFTMDPGASVNTNGQKANLQFYFQPKDNEIYKQMTFKYKFNELGCTYVDFTTEDTVASKDDRERIRFKVINALPTLDNLILEFPQYGNQMGIGFNENSVKDIFNDTYDPLIVKVSALNPKDSDGFISYYKWYYTYKDDPTRYLETKITPGSIPYAFFSLARIPGEFMFGVTIYDNDGGQQSNQDIIGNGPIVFFPPDVNRPDIPLVTLKSDQSTVSIGDTVTFDVISSIVSDRPDFVQERTIQYDFDGDGTRDLTTKSDRVTYVYTTPNQFGYKPRAQVMYR